MIENNVIFNGKRLGFVIRQCTYNVDSVLGRIKNDNNDRTRVLLSDNSFSSLRYFFFFLFPKPKRPLKGHVSMTIRETTLTDYIKSLLKRFRERVLKI